MGGGSLILELEEKAQGTPNSVQNLIFVCQTLCTLIIIVLADDYHGDICFDRGTDISPYR